MNPGDIDALELPLTFAALDADGDARAGQTASAQEPASGRRWWFVFDGWRTADVENEFVLA